MLNLGRVLRAHARISNALRKLVLHLQLCLRSLFGSLSVTLNSLPPQVGRLLALDCLTHARPRFDLLHCRLGLIFGCKRRFLWDVVDALRIFIVICNHDVGPRVIVRSLIFGDLLLRLISRHDAFIYVINRLVMRFRNHLWIRLIKSTIIFGRQNAVLYFVYSSRQFHDVHFLSICFLILGISHILLL